MSKTTGGEKPPGDGDKKPAGDGKKQGCCNGFPCALGHMLMLPVIRLLTTQAPDRIEPEHRYHRPDTPQQSKKETYPQGYAGKPRNKFG